MSGQKKISLQSFNLNHFYYFYEIAVSGSIKAASERLHITSAALSNQLSKLESVLGVRLFDREHRRLELTEDGRIALRYATEAFSAIEDLVLSANKAKLDHKRSIRFGVSNTISYSTAMDVISTTFSEEILVHAIPLSGGDVANSLKQQRLDALVSDTPMTIVPEDWHQEPVRQRRLIVVGSKKYTHLRRQFPKSISNVPFITFSEQNPNKSEIEAYFRENNVTLNVIGCTDMIALSQKAAEAGRALAVLPINQVRESLASKKLFEIGEVPNVSTTVWIAWRLAVDSRLRKWLHNIKKE